jgi:chromosome segregation ATPase
MTEISIKNFQSIKNVDLVVDGFTVIVGRNNIGKSAIIRAVDAALTNRAGDDFIRDGEKSTEIVIKREGLDLEWKKGAKTSYKINGEPFTALNRDIPKPLAEAGFGRMELGDKKVSPLVAHQFDPLFLINKGGSVITEVLAGIYDLDSLSNADDMCQKDLKAQKSMLKTRDGDLMDLQGKLERFKNFGLLKEEVKVLAEKDKACRIFQEEIGTLSEYEAELEALTRSINKLKSIKGVSLPDMSECEKLVEENVWLEEKFQELFVLGTSIKKLKGIEKVEIPSIDLESLSKEVTQLSTWNEQMLGIAEVVKSYGKALDVICPQMVELNKAIPQAEIYSKSFIEISEFEQSFMLAASSAKSSRDELKVVTEDLDKVKKEQVAIKVCPLCESVITW